MAKIFTFIIKILTLLANLFASRKEKDTYEDTSEIATEDTTEIASEDTTDGDE